MTKKLLVRLPNWVGDVIMSLPALDYLAQNNIEPILIGKPWIHDLLKGLPFEKHSIPKKWSDAIELLKSIKSLDMLLFPNSHSSALIAKLAGKNTYGYNQEYRGLLLNHAWKKPDISHQSQLFFHLSELYLKKQGRFETPQLKIDQQSLKESSVILKNYDITPPYIVLCPFAHGLTKDKQSKKWPFWQELITALEAFNCIICPGPLELEQARTNFTKARILPDVKLNEYAALLANAKLVIANDSGPMHVAAAVNAPTVAIFGRTDPKNLAPKNALVIGNNHTWPSLEEVLNLINNRL